jgi:hypothetical protein
VGDETCSVAGWEGLFGVSVLGFMSEAMLVWMRVWGAPVRLMTMGMMFNFLPCLKRKLRLKKKVEYSEKSTVKTATLLL